MLSYMLFYGATVFVIYAVLCYYFYYMLFYATTFTILFYATTFIMLIYATSLLLFHAASTATIPAADVCLMSAMETLTCVLYFQ